MDGELDAGDLAGRWSLDLDALTWIETKASGSAWQRSCGTTR